jgi:hypothetical protein
MEKYGSLLSRLYKVNKFNKKKADLSAMLKASEVNPSNLI